MWKARAWSALRLPRCIFAVMRAALRGTNRRDGSDNEETRIGAFSDPNQPTGHSRLRVIVAGIHRLAGGRHEPSSVHVAAVEAHEQFKPAPA